MSLDQGFEDYFAEFITRFLTLYQVPYVQGGHDLVHVRGVERLGEKIFPHMPNVVPEEYRVAVWLHNVDRCPLLKREAEEDGGHYSHFHRLLWNCPFDGDGQKRIINAVLNHSKKEDDLTKDSPLLTALRIGDKLDRFTPLNIMAGPAHRSDIPHYDVSQPFGYQTNRPCHLKYYLWNLEWYAMLPYDWARGLVDKVYFRLFLSFIRELGRDIAERHQIPNGIEGEIRTALGRYYEE